MPAIANRRWNICDMDDNCLAQIEAESDLKALNHFALSRGYGEYDIQDPDLQPHYINGRLHAPFENFEVMVY